MFSKPIASGSMFMVIVALLGGAAWQQGASEPQAGVHTADVAEDASMQETPEPREATAPGRVVDSAGFPITEEPAGETEVASAPIVTVNGKPLGVAEPEADAPAMVDSSAEPNSEADVQDEEARTQAAGAEDGQTEERSEVAVVEPPKPLPRPEGLEATVGQGTIVRAGSREPSQEFMSAQQRNSLVTINGDPILPAPPQPVANAQGDELVAITNPNGDIIWVYQEQLRAIEGRAASLQHTPSDNPFGFQYD